MKAISSMSLLLMLFCSCSKTAPEPKLTAEDVAWATGTRIAKWDLRKLTSKQVYAVGVVLLGETNEVLSQPGLIGEISRAGGKEVKVALQRDMLQFACGGTSAETKLDRSFEVRFWYGATLTPVRDLIPIASDASHSSDRSESILDSRSRKLCLRIYTEPLTPGKAVAEVQQLEFSPSRSPQELQARVEAAWRASDTNALHKLYNWQGVSEDMRSFHYGSVEPLFKSPKEGWQFRTGLQPPPADLNEETVRDGISYYPNIHVLGNLVLFQNRLENGTNFGHSVAVPYGQTNGMFYLAGVSSKRIYEPKTKDKYLRVEGRGTSFTGICVYIQNGKEIRKDLSEKDAGRGGRVFFGDYVKECRIQNGSQDGQPLRLIITEMNQTVFESPDTRGMEPIVYERNQTVVK